MTVDSALAGGFIALSGTALGGLVALSVEWLRGKNDVRAARRDALLRSCSDLTASLTRARSMSYSLATPGHKERAWDAIGDARVECERLRLLLESKQTQEAARMALRHIYAVVKEAESGVDPRAAQYPGTTPHSRLRQSLTDLYVGVRRETGARNPEDVFEDAPD